MGTDNLDLWRWMVKKDSDSTPIVSLYATIYVSLPASTYHEKKTKEE